MNCAEFQEFLPDVIDGGRTVEQEAHLKTCLACAELVAELNLISREAPQLQEFAEPSPRVWNSIEIALRREGLIREPLAGPELVPPLVKRGWSLAWLVPITAVLAFGVLFYQRGARQDQPVAQVATPAPAAVTSLQTGQNPKNVNNSNEDQQLLEAVGSRSPAMQAQYASNLQNVNAYIRDAEESAQADPNDEEAQQIVMDAYEQRATVYEMALDRSLAIMTMAIETGHIVARFTAASGFACRVRARSYLRAEEGETHGERTADGTADFGRDSGDGDLLFGRSSEGIPAYGGPGSDHLDYQPVWADFCKAGRRQPGGSHRDPSLR